MDVRKQHLISFDDDRVANLTLIQICRDLNTECHPTVIVTLNVIKGV